MSVDSRIVLEPVVELDPFEYRRKERRSPSEPLDAAPQEWEAFFLGALRDAGIASVEPLAGTWLIRLADLAAEPDVLAKVVAVHFGEPDTASFVSTLPGPFDGKSGMNGDGERIEEFCPPLRGGYVLCRGDEILLAPTCCGDLANWRNWLNATRVETEAWQDLWIGHPVARVCQREGLLSVQGVDEHDQLVGPPVVLSADDLAAAVEVAKGKLVPFTRSLRPVLGAELDEDLAGRMVIQLAGLGEFELD